MTPQRAPVSSRILLIEDSSGDVYLLRHALAEHGANCQLDVIQDGEEALQAVERISRREEPLPTVIVLDLNLPKVGGIEILERIRATDGFSGVPVMVLTSSLSDKDKRRAEALGADFYVTKPMGVAEFMALGATLRQLCERPQRGGPIIAAAL